MLEADDPQFRNSDWTPKSWAILNAEGVEIAFTEDVSILGWEACFQYTVRVCALYAVSWSEKTKFGVLKNN